MKPLAKIKQTLAGIVPWRRSAVLPVQAQPALVQTVGRLILLQDRSSSMERKASHVVAGWNNFLQQVAMHSPGMRAILYAVNGEVTSLVREPVEIAAVPQLELSTFHYGGAGILGAGSRLKDGFLRAARRASAWRAEGVEEPIAILMFADGWTQGDHSQNGEARAALQEARGKGVKIAFFAYVLDTPEQRCLMEEFVRVVGLLPDEVYVGYYADEASAGRSVMDVMARATEWTRTTGTGGSANAE